MRMLAAILALAFLLPLASAQLPEPPEPHGPKPVSYDFTFDGNTQRMVPYLGQTMFNFTFRDLSRDSTYAPEAGEPTSPYSPRTHTTYVDVSVQGLNGEPVEGWTAFATRSAFYTQGGQTDEGAILVTAPATASPNYVEILVNVTFMAPDFDVVMYEQEILHAQLQPEYFGYVQVERVKTDAGQDEVLNIPVRVFNYGTYIDTFELNVTGPEDFLIAVTPRVTLEGGQSETVNVSIRTPKGKPYELMRIETLTVNAKSVNEPGVVYTGTAVVQVSGPHISKKWLPMLGIVLICGVLAGRHRAERRDDRKEERGGPRRPRVKPKQAVLLAELKKRDKDAYKEKRTELKAVYTERRQTFKAHIKDREKAEKAERKKAKAEVKAERKRRKKQRKIDRKERKIEAKQERKRKKEERKRKKVLAKEKAKLQKKLDKARKKKEKADAKEAKKRARKEKREAKKQARQEKREARKGAWKRWRAKGKK